MSEITLFKQAGVAIPDYIRADEDDFTRKMAGNPGGKSRTTHSPRAIHSSGR